MTNSEKALKMHEEWHGKIETCAKSHVNSREDLAIAYTPGVAEPCKVIAKDPEAAYTYTMKSNTVAVVSDGSAVLGLGNIGALAAMPVMEGKAVLFKEFGGVNAVPICLDTQDTEEIIKTVVNIAGGSPQVSGFFSPCPGFAVTPFAHAEKNGSSCCTECVSHKLVSTYGVYVVGSTPVVFEVINSPAGVGDGILILVSETSGSATTGCASGIGIDTKFKTFGMYVIG